MDVSLIAGVMPFEQREIPLRLIVALPVEARGAVEEQLRLLDALEDASVAQAGSVNEVVLSTARLLTEAVRTGRKVDLLKEAQRAVADFDAQSVASVASRMAVVWQRNAVVDAAKDAVPAACAAWTDRVQQIAAHVAELMNEGPELVSDELTARRAGGQVLKRWERLAGLLEEYAQIRDAWLEARYLLDGVDQLRYEISGFFMDRLDGDERALHKAMVIFPEPLMAAVTLGWVPWCPLREQQLESSVRVLTERRASVA